MQVFRFKPVLLSLALLLQCALAASPAHATDAAKAAAGADQAKAPPTSFRLIEWDELVPKDWDPMKDFKGLDLGMMRDGDPRTEQLLKKMRAAWDEAPTNNAMENAAVKLPGYVVPLEERKGSITEFLLVPYFGACIHTPPPPANQIIHIKLDKPLKGVRSMDAVWVSGTLSTGRNDSSMGASGYRMSSVAVEKYTAPPDGPR